MQKSVKWNLNNGQYSYSKEFSFLKLTYFTALDQRNLRMMQRRALISSYVYCKKNIFKDESTGRMKYTWTAQLSLFLNKISKLLFGKTFWLVFQFSLTGII